MSLITVYWVLVLVFSVAIIAGISLFYGEADE